MSSHTFSCDPDQVRRGVKRSFSTPQRILQGQSVAVLDCWCSGGNRARLGHHFGTGCMTARSCHRMLRRILNEVLRGRKCPPQESVCEGCGGRSRECRGGAGATEDMAHYPTHPHHWTFSSLFLTTAFRSQCDPGCRHEFDCTRADIANGIPPGDLQFS